MSPLIRGGGGGLGSDSTGLTSSPVEPSPSLPPGNVGGCLSLPTPSSTHGLGPPLLSSSSRGGDAPRSSSPDPRARPDARPDPGSARPDPSTDSEESDPSIRPDPVREFQSNCPVFDDELNSEYYLYIFIV